MITDRAFARLVAPVLLVGLAACGGDASGGDASARPGSARASGSATARSGPPTCGDLTSVPADSMRTTDSGLRILQEEEGEGRAAAAGDTVAVHYLGCLTDGEKFDASRDRNEPIEFPLGVGRVIAGWDEGVEGMKPGGVRILRIPPELAYGSRGTPDGAIPPDATLLFHVELVEVTPGEGGGAG